MPKPYTPSILCLLVSALSSMLGFCSSFAQNSQPDALLGIWHSEDTFCSSLDPGKSFKTHIFPFQSLGFEPQITLHLYDKEGQKFLRKIVDTNSCKSNKIKEPFFLDSTYAVQTSSQIIRGKTIHSMISTKVVSGIVNHEAFESCGSYVNGAVLSILAFLKFPEYFSEEMQRPYNLAIMNGDLYLYFRDPEICKDSPTVMTFKKVKEISAQAPGNGRNL